MITEQEIKNKIILLTKEIREVGNYLSVIRFLELHVEKIRIENDSASGEIIIENQGAIKLLKRLISTLQIIEKKEGN